MTEAVAAGSSAPNKIIFFIQEFWYFGIKQAYACLFGGAFLGGLILTSFLWRPEWLLARYDFLVFYALAIQAAFICFKLESWEEVKVIFMFHIIGTAMEVFKTHMGSWSYPERSLLHIGGVPLFSGFMYSAVGSYIARAWRIFSIKIEYYPRLYLTVILCVLIYINFFTHHFIYDIRNLLFIYLFAIYYRTKFYFRPRETYYNMPFLLGIFLVSLFIWFAENIGSFGRVWVYPNQRMSWHIVPVEKIGSWFLLMMISFVLVTLVHKRNDMFHGKLSDKDKI